LIRPAVRHRKVQAVNQKYSIGQPGNTAKANQKYSAGQSKSTAVGNADVHELTLRLAAPGMERVVIPFHTETSRFNFA
jgi:hypothetical protein